MRKDAAEKAKQEAKEAVAEVAKVREELKKEQEIRATQKAEADFNLRMTDLDSKFDLDDKDRSYIVKDIKGLDDDAYASWIEKFEVFAAKKKKVVVDDAEDEPNKGGDSGKDEDEEDAMKKKKKAAKAAIASAQQPENQRCAR